MSSKVFDPGSFLLLIEGKKGRRKSFRKYLSKEFLQLICDDKRSFEDKYINDKTSRLMTASDRSSVKEYDLKKLSEQLSPSIISSLVKNITDNNLDSIDTTNDESSLMTELKCSVPELALAKSHSEQIVILLLYCIFQKYYKDLVQQKLNSYFSPANRTNELIKTATPLSQKLITRYSPPTIFCGRKKQLDDFDKLLSKYNHILVSGLEGIGKTTFVKQFFKGKFESYEISGFFEYNQDMSTTIFSGLNIDLQEFMDANDAIEWLKLRFRQWQLDTKQKRHICLLIIDNAPDTIEQDSFFQELMSLPYVDLILTSPKSSLPGFENYELGNMTEEDCISTFRSYYGRKQPDKYQQKKYETKNIKKILSYTHKHTLLIELFARLARKYHNLIDFVRKLELKHGKYLVFTHTVSFSNDMQPEAIHEILRKLYCLTDLSLDHQRILCLFSLIPSIDITKDVSKFIDLVAIDYYEDFAHYDWIEGNLLNDLVDNGWIAEHENYYSMHPLVKDIICYDALNEMNYYESKGLDANYFLSTRPIRYKRTFANGKIGTGINDGYISWLPIFRTEYIQELTPTDFQWWLQFLSSIGAYMQTLDYSTWLSYDNLMTIPQLYNQIADMFRMCGDYTTALLWYKDIEDFFRRYGPEVIVKGDSSYVYQRIDDSCFATIYQRMGEMYLNQKQYTKAKEKLTQSLNIFKDCYPEDFEVLAPLYIDLGIANISIYNFDSGRDQLKTAAKLCTDYIKTTLSKNDTINPVFVNYAKELRATAVNAWTMVQINANKWENAELLLNRIDDDIDLEEFKNIYFQLDSFRLHVIICFYKEKNYTTAKSFCRKAIRLIGKKFGEDCFQAAWFYLYLGRLVQQNEHQSLLSSKNIALTNFEKALEICEKTYKQTTDYDLYAAVTKEVSMVYEKHSDYSKSRKVLLTTLKNLLYDQPITDQYIETVRFLYDLLERSYYNHFPGKKIDYKLWIRKHLDSDMTRCLDNVLRTSC